MCECVCEEMVVRCRNRQRSLACARGKRVNGVENGKTVSSSSLVRRRRRSCVRQKRKGEDEVGKEERGTRVSRGRCVLGVASLSSSSSKALQFEHERRQGQQKWSASLRKRLPSKLPRAPSSRSSSFPEVCRWLFALTLRDREHALENTARTLLAVFLSATGKLAGLAVPLLFRHGIELIEDASSSARAFPMKAVVVIFLLSGVCRGLASVASELRSVTFQPVAQSAGRRVAIATFRHIMNLDVGFHLERNIGKLSRIVDRGSRAVAMVFRAVLFTFIPTIIELAFVCALLWRSFSPLCCATVLLSFVCYILFTAHMSTQAAVIRKQVNYIDNLCSQKVVEGLMNVETVKNFDAVTRETFEYNGILVDYQLEAQRSEKNSATLNAGQSLILATGATAVLLIIIDTAATQASSTIVGGLVMASGLLYQVSAPLQFLGFFYRELRQSLVDITDIFDILNTSTKVPQGRTVLDAPHLDEVTPERGMSSGHATLSVLDSDVGPIEERTAAAAAAGPGGIDVSVKNVWFAYPGREPVLRGVSVHAKKGESIALVGPSGSGKSTLLRLIMRQYDVDEGAVLLEGVDVRDLTNKSLRDAIGLVPQESAIFTGTLESNIRYGSSVHAAPATSYTIATDRQHGEHRGAVHGSASEDDDDEVVMEEDEDIEDTGDDAVLAAVRLSQLEGVVDDAPAGLQTMVGARGFTLSGGERQRVALARVFLRDPRLMLCDEATSALDSKTESMILRAIRDIADGRTAITVAHRLSTVVDCDRIYVMRHGAVEEFGTHEELLNRCANDGDRRHFTGLYSELWDLQKREKEGDLLLDNEEATATASVV